MITPAELLQGVTFNPDFNVSSLTYNAELRFLRVADEAVAINGIRLFGFGTPLAPQGYDQGDTVTPLTEFRDLPQDHRSIDEQGKGVGPRLYNVVTAFAGAVHKPPFIGAYIFDIDLNSLLDGRAAQGNTMQRYARHAGRMLTSALRGTEKVVTDIHRMYGAADAVLLETPPLPLQRQALRGVETPAGVISQFLLVRNKSITLHKVGEAEVPGSW